MDWTKFKPDRTDVILILGLILLGIGIGIKLFWLALIVVGAILTVAGILDALFRRK